MSNLYIYYDSISITIIVKRESPRDLDKLGLYIISINALHLSRDINWIKKVFRRLDYKPSETVIDSIKSSVVTGDKYEHEFYNYTNW